MNEKQNQYETTKRYLRRYKKNAEKVKHYEEKLAKIDERLYSISSPVISNEQRGGTPITNAELISDKIELEKRINELVQRGRQFKKDVLDCLDQLDDIREIEVLEAFFLDLKSFDEICDETGYSMRHTIRLYSQGLSKLSMSLSCQ